MESGRGRSSADDDANEGGKGLPTGRSQTNTPSQLGRRGQFTGLALTTRVPGGYPFRDADVRLVAEGASDADAAQTDADDRAWTDFKIADSFGYRTRTVENLRERFVTEGFALTFNDAPKKPRPQPLDGKQEVKLIALRLGPPPKGVPAEGGEDTSVRVAGV